MPQTKDLVQTRVHQEFAPKKMMLGESTYFLLAEFLPHCPDQIFSLAGRGHNLKSKDFESIQNDTRVLIKAKGVIVSAGSWSKVDQLFNLIG